ncbi:MAG: Ig-like domain-containing protein [Spirochaetes bacterium]|nr:Ig-like domain-containing protein [Spirochaetota bacterium]
MNKIIVFFTLNLMILSCNQPTGQSADQKKAEDFRLTKIEPVSGNKDVSVNTNFCLTFNQRVSKDQLGTLFFKTVQQPGQNDQKLKLIHQINCHMEINEQQVIIIPWFEFSEKTIFNDLRIEGFCGSQQQCMVVFQDQAYHIITEEKIDSTNPVIVNIDPEDKSSGISLDQPLIVEYSENIDPNSTGIIGFEQPVVQWTNQSDWSIENNVLTFFPQAGWQAGVNYQGIIIKGFTDLAGNEMDLYTQDYSFTTINKLNLINSSFENGDLQPLDWAMKSSGEVEKSNLYASQGQSSASFTSLTSSISGRELISSVFPIERVNLKVISFFLTSSPVENTKISLKFYFYQDEGGELPAEKAYLTQTSQNLSTIDLWEKISWDRLAEDIPADANFAQIAIRVCYVKNIGTNEDRVYFDQIEIWQ